MSTLLDRIGSLGETGVAELLRRRPDALRAPQPRTLAELADRLARPSSLGLAIQDLPRPATQITEAIVALGPGASREQIVDLMAGDDPVAATRTLATLTDHGIAWLDPDGRVCFPPGLDELFREPLGLGTPLRTLVPPTTVDVLRRILGTLGVYKPPTRKAEVVQKVIEVLSDPDFVRHAVGRAPTPIADELISWAHEGAADHYRGDDDDDDDYDDYDDDDDDDDDRGGVDRAGVWGGVGTGGARRGGAVARPDPDAAQRRIAAARWAVERGLVFSSGWSYGWRMPAEVARALRGPEYRAPFDSRPPAVTVAAADPDLVASQSAGAVTRFAELALALVDRLARTPVPALKTGGVGARELAKLDKDLGCGELDLRLALELCAAVDVITVHARTIVTGPAADAWRNLPPAERAAALLRRWWNLSLTAGEIRDQDGKLVPALAGRSCTGCLRARQAALTTLVDLGPNAAVDPVELGWLALWNRPYVHVLAQDLDGEHVRPFATPLAEAEALGVVAGGAISPIGAALLGQDGDRLRTLLAAALPAANDKALFGADLTAVVAGAPTAGASRLLDACADRESRGGATVWRFTPGSVRRALDEGRTAAALRDELAAIATGELPQPLQYLIADVGRQHGNLRVSAATSIVRGLDEPLLARVAADRALRRLGLRTLAPTVLAADADPDTVIKALRGAGYLPMPDGAATQATTQATTADGPKRGGRSRTSARGGSGAAGDRGEISEIRQFLAGLAGNVRAAVQPAREARLDAAALASRLTAGPAAQTPEMSQTERDLAAARSLSPEEVRILAHAIDTSEPVGIEYVSQSGAASTRVISQAVLSGDTVLAWCELRRDERWFRLDRIQAVFPVG